MTGTRTSAVVERLALARGLGFDGVAQELAAIGLERHPGATLLAPIIPGEPHAARFEGHGVRCDYTFEPAARLRLLELSGPRSSELARNLALAPWVMGVRDLRVALSSADQTERWFGVAAVAALGAAELAPELSRLVASHDRLVAGAAAAALASLPS